MSYGDFKDLTRRMVSDKILRDKANNIAKYCGYQRGPTSVAYILFYNDFW